MNVAATERARSREKLDQLNADYGTYLSLNTV